MKVFQKLRLYHALLAFSALAAYATGGFDIVHPWIGYAVTCIIVFRLTWGILGPNQLRIGRFLPDLASLLRIRTADDPAIARVLLGGVVATLLLVTGTGIALDQLSSLNPATEARAVPVPRAEFGARATSARHVATSAGASEANDDENETWLVELHEFAANMMLLFVGLHVSYMLLFRRPLAGYMLFRPGRKQRIA